MKRKTLRLMAAILVIALTFTLMPSIAGAQGVGAIDPAEFAQPGMEYRPGVRWWWPGNAASTEDLIAQVDYLADNGFGAVEIVAFTPGFLVPDAEGNLTMSGSIYIASDGYDKEAIMSYDTPEYYEKLNAVVQHANERGIIVDLNMGSGYLANDDSVDISDAQANIALGRATIAVDGGEISVVSEDGISVEGGEISIPAAETSPFYVSTMFGYDFGVWDEELINLNAVIVAEVTGEGEALPVNNQTADIENGTLGKTYGNQAILDLANAIVVYPEDDVETFSIDVAQLNDGARYEIIAIYDLPAGSFGLNSYIETNGSRDYVVDHLDADAVKNFVDGWLNDPGMMEVISNDIRAAFNDSYEFYTDMHYNGRIQELAEDGSILDYDITPFLPIFYEFYGESFLLSGAPALKEEYLESGMTQPEASAFASTSIPFIAAGLTEDEAARVEYDYGRILNAAFQEGMASFSDTLTGDYGILYRQQAYNPPIDTLKSSYYVDIPETEGLDEYSLKRVSSGAHLYGKNLVTSEVYTLGTTPFDATPDFIKNGYDLMATSGVNNFFYHGLNAPYYGDPDDPADDYLFTEEGWRGWPTIGVEMAETEAISGYYNEMNTYAARANYAMQAGSQSSDVAVYMPLFGEMSTPGEEAFGAAVAKEAVAALQTNGYVWDAINDDMIQNDLKWEGGRLVTPDGVSFGALVVDSDTVPVETMEALQALADEGAPIIFYGELPSRQPGYAGGDYTALDEQTASIAAEITAAQVADAASLADALSDVAVPISYEANENVRFNRRTLEDGGELAYIRNTSAADATEIALTADDSLVNRYWLDQATGNIYAADSLDITLPANNAIILLCLPDGSELDASAVSSGLPLAIAGATSDDSVELTGFTLEVTADNIGDNVPAEEAVTETCTGEVLGNWVDDAFQGGALKYVSDPGTYTATVDVPDLSVYGGKRALLNLGEVNSAATVYVNGEDLGQLFYAPFEIDVTDALVEGENTIVIEVQPLKVNRRLGLREAYEVDRMEEYVSYVSNASGMSGPLEFHAAGLVGPVSLVTAG